MSPNEALARCIQTLRIVIRTSDENGVVLAERAVDEFCENISGHNLSKDGQLGILTNQVLAVEVPDNSPSLDMIYNIETYITSKRNDLRTESDEQS